MTDPADLLPLLRRLHDQIRDTVVARCETTEPAALAQVSDDTPEDTIYAIDRVSEDALVRFFEREIAPHVPIVLIAEGLPDASRVLPRGRAEAEARWRIIVDPIDGTRGLMYQKRSAWILTGVAPNRGPGTTLADIELALQTEIPLVKQHLCDVLWARRGDGAEARRINRLTGEETPIPLRPSTATDLAQGFASVTRFFPGGRDVLAALDDALAQHLLGTPPAGKALCFEDQYLCTGGQLHALASGQDRFLADLRPLLAPVLARRGWPAPMCCHPYDVCTELIAREAGVLVTDPAGRPLQAPLTTDHDVAWIGYANATLRRSIEPVLQRLLAEQGL
ncbi:inositol monophosphatase [Rhodothermaceae bacterium RA]|nr:inositol monophosphatase [Rhodothermaceae bacterium RA]